MSVISGNAKGNKGSGYRIARSLRFRASNSAYLSRTAGTPTSSTTFLWSGWVKRGSLTANNSIVGGFDGTSYDDFRFQSTDVLRFYVDAATGATIDTVALFRDPSAVYHVILAIDTTQSTQSNRCFIIVNGAAQALTGNTLGSSYSFLYFNKGTKVQNIGRFGFNATAYNDCYMSEINFVDGYPTGVTQATWSASTVAALFGTTDATTGAWTPKAYSGAFGNNGYYLPFSDNSGITPATLGKDTSGTKVLSTTGTTASSTALTAIAGTVSPQVNQIVTGSGIPSNTYLTVVGGVSGAWTATMSAAATTTVVGGALVFTGNNWTPSGISITAGVTNDSLVDTPTNYGTDSYSTTVDNARGNYATLNPLDKGATCTLSNGNLTAAWSGGSIIQLTRSTFALSDTQDMYWEASVDVNSNGNAWVGAADARATLANYLGADAYGWGYAPSATGSGTRGNKFNNQSAGTGTLWGKTCTGFGLTTYGFYWKSSTRELFFRDDTGWMNGSNSNDATPTTSAYTLGAGVIFPAVSMNAGGTQSATMTINAGQRPFAYTAPSGAKALCTQNLPTPAIPKPSLFMDVNTRAGTGAAFNVTGKGFQPDVIWTKNRTSISDHAITDSQFNYGKYWSSNQAAAYVSDAQAVTAFNSDGFSGGTAAIINTTTSSAQFVDWMFKESVTAGIDLVKFSGNSTNRTIGHSLNPLVPSMLLIKRDGASGGVVWHTGIGSAANYLALNSSAASASDAGAFNSTAPTSLVFSVGTNNNTNATGTNNMLAILFAEVAGFSKFGSYTGNASTDGPFVWCGFRPRWVMVKNVTTGALNWLIWDAARTTYNLVDYALYPNGSNVEVSGWSLDFLANGFKIRDIESNLNESGGTHIFAAFAESPFKYARAR